MAGALYGAGAGLAINAGWRIACPVSTPWHALGAHGAAIIATVILGAFIGRFLGNRRLHSGATFLSLQLSPIDGRPKFGAGWYLAREAIRRTSVTLAQLHVRGAFSEWPSR